MKTLAVTFLIKMVLTKLLFHHNYFLSPIMEKQIEQLKTMILLYAPNVLLALLSLVLGFWIISWITKLLTRTMGHRHIDPTVSNFLTSLVSVGLKVLLLLSVASQFGFQTTSFIAILSAMAFAVGLAMQGSLGHFASGVMLLVLKPYRVGDLVELNDKVGVVEGIHIFNTTLRTVDNKRIFIPNGLITGEVITNISGQGEIRVDMTYGINYDSDIDLARKIILEVAQSCPEVLKDKPVDVFVSELAESSVRFAVRPWTNSAHYWDVYFYMQENIKKAFDKAGILPPFPQRTVHMVTK